MWTIRLRVLAAAMAVALVAVACGGNDDGASTADAPTTAPPAALTPERLAQAAGDAAEQLGDQAPSAIFVALVRGASLEELLDALDDGSLTADGQVAAGDAPTVQPAAYHQGVTSGPVGEPTDAEIAEAMSGFRAEMDRIRDEVRISDADRDVVDVFTMLVLKGLGYGAEQIEEAGRAGNIAMIEGDPNSCLWSRFIAGFPPGQGLVIRGVDPVNPSSFGEDPCGEPSDQPDDPPDDAAPTTGEALPPDGPQVEFRCEPLEPPSGMTLTVDYDHSNYGPPDESGNYDNLLCNFTVDASGARHGLAVTVEYACEVDTFNSFQDKVHAGNRQILSDTMARDREEKAEDETFSVFAGEFRIQDRLFVMTGPYSIATMVLHTDGATDVMAFVDFATRMADEFHPTLEFLGCPTG